MQHLKLGKNYSLAFPIRKTGRVSRICGDKKILYFVGWVSHGEAFDNKQSVAEMGGIDDLKALEQVQVEQSQQPGRLQRLIDQSRTLAKPLIFISLRAQGAIALEGN